MDTTVQTSHASKHSPEGVDVVIDLQGLTDQVLLWPGGWTEAPPAGHRDTEEMTGAGWRETPALPFAHGVHLLEAVGTASRIDSTCPDMWCHRLGDFLSFFEALAFDIII